METYVYADGTHRFEEVPVYRTLTYTFSCVLLQTSSCA